MIVIYAEKGDMAQKIAAALDKITLDNGTEVSFNKLEKYSSAIKKQQSRDGYLDIIFQGEECKVIWGFGHLFCLKQAEDYNPNYKKWNNMPMPFFPDPIETKFIVSDNKFFNDRNKKQLSVAKTFFKQARYIINATDDDREGEVIFAYLYENLKCKVPVKRAVISSNTKNGLASAFNSLVDKKSREKIEEAGKTRGVADWLVGSNLTAAITLANQGNGVLSIGRVQTPTLNLIVERELAIKGFSSKNYYTLDGSFTTDKNDTYKGTHINERFDTKSDADSVFNKITGKTGKIADIKKSKYNKEIPQLYSLSVLQMDANSKFGFSLNKTLDIAQYLYENGYTTYPRTSSRYLNEDKEAGINDVLDRLSTVPEYNKLIAGKPRIIKNKKQWFDDSKVISHFAIIPTGKIPKNIPSDEMKVYDLIARSVIRMIYDEAVMEKTELITVVDGEEFVSNGTTIIESGWMTVGDSVEEKPLPNYLKTGDTVTCNFEVNEKQTKPPKRYTDKTLVTAMCSAGKTLNDAELKKILSDPRINGIGTEATRANIVKTLEQRGFISYKGKQIFATDKGISLIKAIPIDDFKSAEMTAKWEQRLLDIELGKDDSDSFIKDIKTAITQWVSLIQKTGGTIATATQTANIIGKCPICGKDIIKHKWGYGCSGYKDKSCNFSISEKIAGKKISDSTVKQLLNKGETAEIKGFKSKAGKLFNAKLFIDDNKKVSFKFE